MLARIQYDITTIVIKLLFYAQGTVYIAKRAAWWFIRIHEAL